MIKINIKNFKNTLNKFSTGITVISINHKEKYIGKTVNSFASLSLNPPLVLFSLDKKSSSIKNYINSSFIGINILSRNQKLISNHFSMRKPDWEKTKCFITSDFVPMINGCVANLNCKKKSTLSQGDHVIFICEVSQIKFDDSKKPLIYFNSKYI